MYPSLFLLPEDVEPKLEKTESGLYVDKTAYQGVYEYFPGRLLKIVGNYQVVQPPFTDEQVAALIEYQKEALIKDHLREFRCSLCDSNNIQVTTHGLVCIACRIVRDWVPKSLANWKQI